MFYSLIKIIARLTLLFFFRRKIICGKSLRALKGPAIIAANHPDSLMDAVVIGCCCSQQVHFTIRSDMFNNKLFKILLNRLNGIPVYRSSEEKGKLRENFNTIEHCKKILKNNGIIIIFAEGQTLHDWNIKPIKSGVSKIVRHAINDEQLRTKLAVVPVGLTYSDYKHPAKTIIIQTGDSLFPGNIDCQLTDGMWRQAFNSLLFQKLQPLIPCMRSEKSENIQAWQIVIKSLDSVTDCNSIQQLHCSASIIEESGNVPDLHLINRQYLAKNRKVFYISAFLCLLLVVPGIAGLILNAAYYFPVSRWAYRKTKNSIFYDALLCGLITITYPIYIIIASILLHFATGVSSLFWIPLLPFTGWCTVQAYAQLLTAKNYILISENEKKFLDEVVT